MEWAEGVRQDGDLRATAKSRFVPLPKSVQPDRIKAYADVYDFELDEEYMKWFDGSNRGEDGEETWNPVGTD